MGVQGRSLWPVLQGKPFPQAEFESVYGETGYTSHRWNWADDAVSLEPEKPSRNSFQELNSFSLAGVENMVCKDDWKLIYTQAGEGELYHLKADPAEVDNLFGNEAFADKRNEMMQVLLTHKMRVEDELPDAGHLRKRRSHNWWNKLTPEEK